jgi:hypothetical protein
LTTGSSPRGRVDQVMKLIVALLVVDVARRIRRLRRRLA